MEPSPLLDDPSLAIDQRTLNALPDHSGERRQEEVEFFAEPPREIGTVISAESTLRQGRRGKALSTRLLIGAVVGGALVSGGYWLGHGDDAEAAGICQALGWGLGVTALVCTVVATRFTAVCTFVGQQGIARFTLKGQREAMPVATTLVFAQAEELRAKQTKQYYNGVYTGTTYDYTWTGPDGQRLWRAKGSYRERKKGLKPGEPFRFAQAAEIAWTAQFIDRADKVLKSEGSIPFRIDARRVVRVGPGFLEFHFGGEPMRLTTDDIASVSLASGTFQFKHKDAKWYSLSGKYSFGYGAMANARAFLHALERLMGYRWG